MHAHEILERYRAGRQSAPVTLAQLVLAAGSPDAALAALPDGDPAAEGLRALAERHADGLAEIARVIAAERAADAGGDPLARQRDFFAAAVAGSPESSVALYSLGDPALLAAATAEIVALLESWALIGPGRRALDLGCGIGRLTEALARLGAEAVGVDMVPGMLAAAAARCAGLPGAHLVLTDGRGLAAFADAAFDLVLAVDSFPYLVEAGLAARHLADSARLLRPGGHLLILNYSYRGDVARDAAELGARAAALGLVPLRLGSRDLTLWDGISFLLRQPAAG
jgi:SAM-dependent methyltransferase